MKYVADIPPLKRPEDGPFKVGDLFIHKMKCSNQEYGVCMLINDMRENPPFKDPDGLILISLKNPIHWFPSWRACLGDNGIMRAPNGTVVTIIEDRS